MPSGFILFFIGLAIGYMLGQTSVRDQMRKTGVNPSSYESGSWIDKVISIFTTKKDNNQNPPNNPDNFNNN